LEHKVNIMDSIIPFPCKQEVNDEHLSGIAKCLSCKHEWIYVAPVGTVWLECPACTLLMGRLAGPVDRIGYSWECNCGNELFKITPKEIYCICCGVPYNEN